MKSIFGTVAGSFLFGTPVDGSDIDIRGVHIPNAADIAMQRVKVDNSPLRDIDADAVFQETSRIALRYAKSIPPNDRNDVTSMPLHQFLSLVAKGEITTVELMFAPNHYWIQELTDYKIWLKVQQLRPLLVTRDINRAVGFCRNVVVRFGARADRLESATKAQAFFHDLMMKHGNITLLKNVESEIEALTELDHIEKDYDPHNIPMLRVCNRGIQYTTTLKNGYEIITAVVNSYGKRAKASSNPDKKDWKAVMHSLRVSEQVQELLQHGTMTFPRPNASSELLAVRRGERSMQDVMTIIDENIIKMEEMVDQSPLPETPDYKAMEDLVMELYGL